MSLVERYADAVDLLAMLHKTARSQRFAASLARGCQAAERYLWEPERRFEHCQVHTSARG